MSHRCTPSPLTAALAALAFLLVPASSSAPALAKTKESPPAAPDKSEKKDDDSPFKEWDKTLKDSEAKTGFFTVHRRHDNIWMEVAPEQLDKPFLMISSVSRGLGKGRLLGGMPLDTDLWALHRAGNKVQILVKNTRFVAAPGSAMQKAVELSYGDSVLATAKIVSIHKEDNHLLLDMNEVLVSDLPGISLALKQTIGGPAPFDKDRSAVKSIKVFPKNIEIDVAAVFNSPEAKPLDGVSDPRYLPVGIHYSLSELPEDGYRARLADDRVGFFLTAIKDFSHDSSDTFFVRYINRWNLEKQDPIAPVSPPKEPIVYYLDSTIPEQYRPYVREGLLMWNKAFEKAGFKDAVVVKDPPDDPDFDPEDVRYNTVRWITSTEPSFGAIGPSRVDPRNGHILDADILVEAAMVQNARRGYRNLVNTISPLPVAASPYAGSAAGAGTGGAGRDVGGPAPGAEWLSSLIQRPDSLCNLADGAQLNAAVDAALMQSTGEITPGGPVPEEYIRQFLHWVVSHEVGHTLGLRHNFRASAATPNAKLNDIAWTREHGLYGSVMEYPASNISLDRNAQGDYYTQTVGDYDLWAIQYGYMPVSAKTPQDEVPALKKVADRAAQAGLEYGTDEDAYPGPVPMGVDPDITQFDLGADPVAYARERLALITMVRGKIQASGTAEGESYDRVRNTFDSLMSAQSQVLQIVAKQVGGLSTSRTHKGDPGQRPAFTMVPPERQRDAMKVIAELGFADAAWSVPPGLLDSLQPNHWWHWGIDLSKSVPFDYPYTDRVQDIQAALLDYVMHPVMLSRIAEIEATARKGGAYTLAEHLKGITDSAFSELGPKGAVAGAFGISPTRRNLERAVLNRLIILMNTPPAGTPDDARSLARANIVTIEKRIGSVLLARAAGMDEATKAFLDESRARIKRALAAQTVVTG